MDAKNIFISPCLRASMVYLFPFNPGDHTVGQGISHCRAAAGAADKTRIAGVAEKNHLNGDHGHAAENRAGERALLAADVRAAVSENAVVFELIFERGGQRAGDDAAAVLLCDITVPDGPVTPEFFPFLSG